MKLSLPRHELKEALTGIAKVTNSRAALPALSHVRLDAHNASVHLTGTDLDQTVSYAMSGVSLPGTTLHALLPLDALLGLLKTAQGPDITLDLNGHALTMGCSVGGQIINRRINTLPTEDWPELPAPAAVRPVSSRLLGHIRQAMPFASTDDSRHVLKGVYLDVQDAGCHKIVATDGRRLTALNSVRLPLSESVTVPASKFLTWNKLTGEPSIGADKEREVFTLQAGPWTYTTKLASGTYPNYRQVIPGGAAPTTLELAPEDADLLVQALPGLPGHHGCPELVLLAVQADNSRVYSQESPDHPESAIVLAKSKAAGPPVILGLNRQCLRDALTAGFRFIGLTGKDNPLVARLSPDDQHSVHVLMPMRISGTELTNQPSAVTTQPKEHVMRKKEAPQAPAEISSFDKILSAYEVARAAVRDANAALSAVAEAIKEAVKEDKARRREIADVRAGLAKLQSIKV